MVTTDIDRLLARYFAGELQPQDDVRLDSWLNDSEENEKYFFELTSLYQNVGVTTYPQFDTQKASDKFNGHIEKDNGNEKARVGKKNKFLLFALSAVAAIAALFIIFNEEKNFIIINELNAHTLADNTEVNLTEGKFQLSNDKANDTIYLDGAAHFKMESEHVGSKIVKAGKVYIKDIGTQFTVDAKNADSVAVSVTEGEVHFYSDNNAGINLRIQERGYYLQRTNSFHKVVPRGSFNFAAAPLVDVAGQLTQYYGQTIRLNEDSLNGLLINANFQDEDLSTVLDILSIALNIKISYINHEHVVEKR